MKLLMVLILGITFMSCDCAERSKKVKLLQSKRLQCMSTCNPYVGVVEPIPGDNTWEGLLNGYCICDKTKEVR